MKGPIRLGKGAMDINEYAKTFASMITYYFISLLPSGYDLCLCSVPQLISSQQMPNPILFQHLFCFICRFVDKEFELSTDTTSKKNKHKKKIGNVAQYLRML